MTLAKKWEVCMASHIQPALIICVNHRKGYCIKNENNTKSWLIEKPMLMY